MKRIVVVLTLAVAFCFVLASLAQAGASDPVTKGWANRNLVNKNKAPKIPIWKITQDGTAKSVKWANHTPNLRFAIHDRGTPGDETDDCVLDKETGLVWARDANLPGEKKQWMDAVKFCRKLGLGNRVGWRLPTVEELSSLLDRRQSNPALPQGHPFTNVPSTIDSMYWSSTTAEDDGSHAWRVEFDIGAVNDWNAKGNDFHVWPVRGGNGYATGDW